jgi:hypothetical protein
MRSRVGPELRLNAYQVAPIVFSHQVDAEVDRANMGGQTTRPFEPCPHAADPEHRVVPKEVGDYPFEGVSAIALLFEMRYLQLDVAKGGRHV